MSAVSDGDPGIRIRVHPAPTPEELAAIVAVVRRRRMRQVPESQPTPTVVSSHWARAGRREAMAAREHRRDERDAV